MESRQGRQPAFSPGDSVEPSVVRYLAKQDRSQAQVKAFLVRRGLSPARVLEVIAHLSRQGYLDDSAYALRWARARLSKRPSGRLRLEAELLKQGFDRTTTEKTLELVYRERPERDFARMLLERRAGPGRSGKPPSAAGLLRRQGFEEEMIEDLLGGSQTS